MEKAPVNSSTEVNNSNETKPNLTNPTTENIKPNPFTMNQNILNTLNVASFNEKTDEKVNDFMASIENKTDITTSPAEIINLDESANTEISNEVIMTVFNEVETPTNNTQAEAVSSLENNETLDSIEPAPLPEVDGDNLNAEQLATDSTTIINNETEVITEEPQTITEVAPEDETISVESAPEKKKWGKIIAKAIGGIALAATVATVGIFQFFKPSDVKNAAVKAATNNQPTVESTQSTHETAAVTTKPNTNNKVEIQTQESNDVVNSPASSSDSKENQLTNNTNTTTEVKSPTQESTITSNEYTPATNKEIMQYRPDFLNVLSSTESVNMLFEKGSPDVDKLGSWCFEQTVYGGYLDSKYDKKWEYKRVNADSPIEDIVNNTNIELAAAHASNEEIDGKTLISKPKCYAIANYVFDNATSERSNILKNIDESERPTKLTEFDIATGSSEVFTCKKPNGETTRSIVIDVQMGDRKYKRVYSEKLVEDFKGEKYIQMKVSGLEDANLSYEDAIAASNLVIVK